MQYKTSAADFRHVMLLTLQGGLLLLHPALTERLHSESMWISPRTCGIDLHSTMSLSDTATTSELLLHAFRPKSPTRSLQKGQLNTTYDQVLSLPGGCLQVLASLAFFRPRFAKKQNDALHSAHVDTMQRETGFNLTSDPRVVSRLCSTVI